MENVRNYRDIKLVTSEKRRKRSVSEPNYHAHKKFSDHLMAIEMKKTKVKMTKPIFLGLSILNISKTLMYKFWYDYIKPKYVTWILIALLLILKPKIFIRALLMRNGSIHSIMMKMIKDTST